MDKISKTDPEIKDQILNWFFKYHRQSADDFSGQEQFVPFDKLSPDEQKHFSGLLSTSDIPVLVLKADKDNTTICTTRRFVHLENGDITELKYTDFDKHNGYKSIAIPGHAGPAIGIKTDGYIADFGLQKTDGQIVYWKIPTGHSGFAFWNVTKKFDIIGRKYLVDGDK
jgi:hypothetical protein